MFNGLKLYALLGGLAVALVAFGAIYLKGRADGAGKAYIEQLESTITDYKIWDKADVETTETDFLDLCVELGGMFDDCKRELRDQEAAKTK